MIRGCRSQPPPLRPASTKNYRNCSVPEDIVKFNDPEHLSALANRTEIEDQA